MVWGGPPSQFQKEAEKRRGRDMDASRWAKGQRKRRCQCLQPVPLLRILGISRAVPDAQDHPLLPASPPASDESSCSEVPSAGFCRTRKQLTGFKGHQRAGPLGPPSPNHEL